MNEIKETCPECGSGEIKSLTSGHSMENGKSAFKEVKTVRFECEKCGWSWKNKQ